MTFQILKSNPDIRYNLFFYYYVKRSWFFVDFVYPKLYNKNILTYSKNTGKEYGL